MCLTELDPIWIYFIIIVWVAYLCIIDCNSVYYRVATSYQIDSLLACLINADACDAWLACWDSPHAFPVVLFAASTSHVCVPNYFSFFPFSFFSFQWSSFFLFLSPYTSFVREVPEDGSMLCRVEIELPLTHFPCSLRQIFFWAHPQPTQTSAYEQATLQAILCQRCLVHKEWRNVSCWANLRQFIENVSSTCLLACLLYMSSLKMFLLNRLQPSCNCVADVLATHCTT